LRGSAIGTWGGHEATGNQSVGRMSRKTKKAKQAVQPETYQCSPLAMTIVVLARAIILNKRGKDSVVEAGPATDALARLIMTHDRERLGKITPAQLQAYEKIAATLTTDSGPHEELWERL